MTNDDAFIEIIADSVEEAIEKGLDQLCLPIDAVEVEVLEEGRQGFLGLKSRSVKVRLSIRDNRPHEEKFTQTTVRDLGTDVKENIPSSVNPDDMDKIEENKDSAIEIVKKLVANMGIEAHVTGRVINPEDDKDQPMILVEINGKDLSVLIGRRSETLNALQYIASLILCEKAEGWVPLTIDVQGYRSRRERQLRQLARRLADQVVETGRKQVLEPMPANERRIIHLELRYHPFVTTASIGEEPVRRATIFIKPK